VVVALSLWYGVGTLYVFPNEISYFNRLAGGPREGYRYLVDYTQDWGQSFKQLRGWLETHPGPEPKMAYYTYMHPGFYGVAFRPIPPAEGAAPLPDPFRPPPGRYVIGVTPLQGIVGRDRMAFEWFRRTTPTAKVGETLFVYDVAPFEGSWVAQCHVPAIPLTGDAIQEGLGRKGLRQVVFNCAQSWVYPGGSQEGGWYALHGQLYAPVDWGQRLLYDPPRAVDSFMARHLEGVRFAYQQAEASLLPPFVLYEFAEQPKGSGPIHVWTAAAATAPTTLVSTAPVSVPLSLDGPLDFAGVEVFQTADALEVESWWLVKHGPVARPLSLMAHLVGASGQTFAVADGLGFSPLEWTPGDVLVQRHVFPAPAGDTELWLRAGAYWLNDGRRWEPIGPLKGDALFIPIDQVLTRR
jgi:hypothetical protein